MISDFILVLILITAVLLFIFTAVYFVGQKRLVNLFIFVVFFFISCLILMLYFMNKQIHNLNTNKKEASLDLKIIDNYLLTISPLIIMQDEEGNEIYYPGIYT